MSCDPNAEQKHGTMFSRPRTPQTASQPPFSASSSKRNMFSILPFLVLAILVALRDERELGEADDM